MPVFEIPFELVCLEDDFNFMPLVHVLIGANEVGLVIDTGASHTCLDKELVKKFRPLEQPKSDNTVMGIGGRRLSHSMCELPDFQIGGLHLECYKVVAIRMKNVNKMLKWLGRKPIGGLLGCDFLECYHAVLDFNNRILRLEQPENES